MPFVQSVLLDASELLYRADSNLNQRTVCDPQPPPDIAEKDSTTMASEITTQVPGEPETGNNNEVERLRAELEAAREESKAALAAARGETQALKDEKNLAVVHARMRKVWREKGLIDDIDAQRAFAKAFLGADEDGSPIVRGHDGKELIGVTIEQFVDDLATRLPALKRGSDDSGGSSAPVSRVRAKDDLKTTKEKADYIAKFGLPAWEQLPGSRPKSRADDPELAVLNWTNQEKGEYLRKHSQAELSELLRLAHEKKRTGK